MASHLFRPSRLKDAEALASSEDGPRHDGTIVRRVLAQCSDPVRVTEIAVALGWSYSRAHTWAKYLRRTGRLAIVAWRRSPKGRRVAVYQASRSSR